MIVELDSAKVTSEVTLDIKLDTYWMYMTEESGSKPLYIYSQTTDLQEIKVYKIQGNDLSTVGSISKPGVIYVGMIEKA